ncbi:hypothetical protein HCA61_16620 [Rhodococcus sp. HNM0563]|uniref:hypothetical protein n=1 Tax=unclassified Rhodococcus (in: high G+C Gram-positive bacteria) TaxID=192944 RepID=UPI00146C5980|nr:hypothetical protein [Rhodococcus sp. F64268]MCK0091250.1 hypothetical protein [Rhodococcus sp. F64268]NLU63880.1 hypothetical protein [Rhodococcus sp. HNM0563]
MSIEIGDLNAVARRLATGAIGINDLGSDAAEIPDAGPSTVLLVDTLGSIASALDVAVRSLANAADVTQDSLRAYQETDDHNAQGIAKAGEQ